MTRYWADRVVYHPGRAQPFTVWCDGTVVLFAVVREDAERRLRYEQMRSELRRADRRAGRMAEED
jgi:hypothetical protein